MCFLYDVFLVPHVGGLTHLLRPLHTQMSQASGCDNLVTTCDKVETCLAFLYGTVCSRFDQDGYRVLSKMEALLCGHEEYLGDFDEVLSLYRIDLDQDHLAILLHVLQLYTQRS